MMKINLLKKISDNVMYKDSIKVVILRLCGALLLFTVTLYITNNFDAELVGQYDLSRSILFIFGSFCLLGLNQSIIYYSGVFKARNTMSALKDLYKKMITVIIVLGLFFLLGFFLFPKAWINGFYNKDVYGLVLKTFFVLAFHAITMLNIDVYRAVNKIVISEVFRNIYRYLFFFIGLFYLVQINAENSLVDIFLINYVFLAIVSSVFVFLSFTNINNTNNYAVGYKEMIKRSYPMSISLVSFLLLQSTDIILLGKYVSFEEVAYYGVAVKLTLLISTVLHSVSAVYAPKIAELNTLNDISGLKSNLKNSARLIFFLTIPAILLLLLFSDYFLTFFGQSYTDASMSLNILLVGQIINAATGVVGIYMNMTGKQQLLQNILIIALILNLILNLLLIPAYGLEGAAIATTISTIFWNVYCAVHLYLKNGIKTFLH